MNVERNFLFPDADSKEDPVASPLQTIESLKEKGELGELYAECYSIALREYPEVVGVDVVAKGPEDVPKLAHAPGFARHQSVSETGRPMVVMNVDSGMSHIDRLMQEAQFSVQLCAEKLGLSAENITSSQLGAFIFLHELGHAYDYIVRVPDGAEKKQKRVAEMATLPLPGWTPSKARRAFAPGGRLALWFEQNREEIALQGYHSHDELLEAQSRAYRLLPSEMVADEFAVHIMTTYSDSLP